MDTVGDFLTRIRNAGTSKHEKVDIPSSNVRKGLADVLRDSGYIKNYKVVPDGKQGMMRIYLKYREDGAHAITSVERRSRPGRRYYVPTEKIPNVRSGYGLAVLSTSKGILSGAEATKQNVGGELICTLW